MSHLAVSYPSIENRVKNIASMATDSIGRITDLSKTGLANSNRLFHNNRKTLTYKSSLLYSKTHDKATRKMYLAVWNMIGTIVQDSERDWEKDTFDHEFTAAEQTFLLSSLNTNKEVTNASFPQLK